MNDYLLTVVMPVYNVRTYLPEAIESVRRQSYENLEIVLVDDGSTDDSGRICDEYAYKDPRVRVLHQPNGGLSNARNNGVAQATGEFLTFIDSDDLLFDDSYERMMRTIEETGSDFVSGNVERFNTRKGWQAWNQESSHREDRFRTTLADHPELVFDAVAWNKVFNRHFYTTAGIRFPEGKLYEDMVPMYSAYRVASSVDVLKKPTYRWRIRDENNSISQRRSEYQNLADKVEMVDTIYQTLRDPRMRKVRESFFRKVLEGDLWLYVEHVNSADSQEFDDLLVRAAKKYWRAAPVSVKMRLEQERRVLYAALSQGKPEVVQPIQQWYRTNRNNLPVIHRRNGVYLDTTVVPSDWPKLSSIERSLAAETRLGSSITGIYFDEVGSLHVRGWAHVTLWPAEKQRIQLYLEDAKTGHRTAVPIVQSGLPSDAAAAASVDPRHDFSHVGFEAAIGRQQMAALAGNANRTRDWYFVLSVRTPESTQTTRLTSFVRGGSVSAISPIFVTDDIQVVPVAMPGEDMKLAVRRPHLVVLNVQRDDRTVAIDFRLPGEEQASSASAKTKTISAVLEDDVLDRKLQLEVERLDRNVARVRFDLPATVAERYVTWRLWGEIDGRKRRMAWAAGKPLSAPESQGVAIRQSVGGWLVVTESVQALEVTATKLRPDGPKLSIEGAVPATEDEIQVGFVRDGEQQPKAWFVASVAGTSVTADIDLFSTDWYGVARPWRPGRYHLAARRLPKNDQRHDQLAASSLYVTVTAEATQELLQPVYGSSATVELQRIGGHDLQLKIDNPITPQERGVWAKERSLQSFGSGARVEPENSILLRVNMGFGANDSALYLHREIRRRGLDWNVYWAVRNRAVAVPEDGIPVVDGQQIWYEKLARSRIVVNNYGGIWRYPGHPHQVYLQTWHGTPYKAIGMSEVRHRGGQSSDYDRVRQESSEWDFLLSPNPYCSMLFPKEFGYDGPLLALGMPRNDFAVTAAREDQNRIRAKLGIEPGPKVALYAPTYRETDRRGYDASLYRGLDVHRLATLLGPEWIVLVRGHSFTERTSERVLQTRQVMDVTDIPDIAELYVASDACITDYSSAMFDFVATGKPLYHFTPDLTEYVRSRSVYFDLKDVAPSTLHTTVEGLADDVRDLDGYHDRYGYRYQAFRQSFVPWDDGHAAERVLDAILAEAERR